MHHGRSTEMHNIVVAGILSLLLAVAAVPVAAQVAGSTTIGVAPDEVKTLTRGWSAKKQILDKPVYNDQDERVGEVEDLIITPDKALSYAIIGVGGFLGLGTHSVAVPVNQFQTEGVKIVLPGATKDTLKAMPPFVYSR
jgi:sporulation protein YlmC with PRC-barrel domain